jgi:hypothetical protein
MLILSQVGYVSVMVLSLYGRVTGLNLISRISAEYFDSRVGICFLLILLMNVKIQV